MRKNRPDKQNLNVYDVFLIKEKNIESLIRCLKREKISLYKIKKLDDKTTELTIKRKETEKFFAILENLCYNNKNVIKVGEKGFSLRYGIYKNLGIVIGAILFIIATYFFDNVILKIDYYGEGAFYSEEVGVYLENINVKKYTLFSSIDNKKLEKEVLSSFDNLSFVSISKSGNTLKIRLEPLDNKKTPREKQDKFVSSVSGRLLELKVYRGTARFKAGDYVKVGDVLVSNVMTVKDNNYVTNVIACASVLTCFDYEITLPSDNMENEVYLLLSGSLDCFDDIVIEKQTLDNGFLYKAKVYKKTVISCG